MPKNKSDASDAGIGFFERNLTVWVVLCMIAGVLLGRFLPGVPAFLDRFEYAHVSIPIAILIWLMIYPMMLKVDFTSIGNVGKNPKGLYVTWITNWLVKPFTMYAIAWFFFNVAFKAWIPSGLARDYLAGAILLGAAPCTAMVFVWSHLTRGNPAYTVVQVATNDLIILIAFTPIVAFLLGIGGVTIPWPTLILSVVLFVVIPLAGGILTRSVLVRSHGEAWFTDSFIPRFGNVTIAGLLLTLIILFSFQGKTIIANPLHILLIAVPLTIQTFLIFFIAYFFAKKLKLSHDIAAPAGMIGASNFFELSVAVAISLFGSGSPAVLATVVGVLVEVPVMLTLVNIANRTKDWFAAKRRVMFICIHNSGRSQMGEAFLRKYAGNRFEVHSAGIEAGVLNPLVVKSMEEIGISLKGHYSKKASDYIERQEHFDYVITVCDETNAERCPMFPGKHERLHWGFPDPSAITSEPALTEAAKLAAIRPIRDEIGARVREWLFEMDKAHTGRSSRNRIG